MATFSHFAKCVPSIAALALIFCPGCAKEDSELQRQIVELRAEVQSKTTALEEAKAKIAQSATRAAPTPTASVAQGVSKEELAKAKERISQLEGEVAKLNTANASLNEKLQSQSTSSAPSTPVPMKFDVDALKDKLEDDLTKKAAELRDLVLRQNGVTAISEISVQRLQLPPEVITPFHSAITFTMMDNGKPLRVQFPVTADFGGSWRLPSPDKIQQACEQAREQLASGRPAEPEPAAPPVATPPPASTPPPATSAPASTPKASRPVASSAPASSTSSPGSGHASIKRVDSNTFVMDWGDHKAATASAAPAAPPPPSTSAPAPAPRPAAPASSEPTTASAPLTPKSSPAKSSAAPTNVPKPVMPVQRDIIIKF